MVMQLVADAQENQVVRAQVRNVLSKAEKLIGEIDCLISNVVVLAANATEVRTIDVRDDLEPVTLERLKSDLEAGKLVQERVADLLILREKLMNQIEQKVGGVGRLMLHTTMAMNHWWMDPVEKVVGSVGSEVVSVVDRSIKGVNEKIVAPALSADIVGSTYNSIRGLFSSMPHPDFVFADMVKYAELFIAKARNAAASEEVNQKLTTLLEAAERKLNSLKNKLPPNVQRLGEDIIKNSIDGCKKTCNMTMETGEKLLKAYGKTKDMTFSYFKSRDVMVIPSDVWNFCQVLIEKKEGDAAYNTAIAELHELYDLLSEVFELPSSKQSEASSEADYSSSSSSGSADAPVDSDAQMAA